MAVDSHIIVEKCIHGKWQLHAHFSTQDTRAYCALAGIDKAAKQLHIITNDEVTTATFELLEEYEVEKADLSTIHLSDFFTLLNQLAPNHPSSAPDLIAEIAAKYQEAEHINCMSVIKELCLPINQVQHQDAYRVILFWGY
ncbi:MAG: hypothetical protein ACPGJS_12010 [Flammeovirgaceae bacterium]